MIIKNKDNHQGDIDYLSDLLERELPDDQKTLVDRELKCLFSSEKGEETSADYLDSEFKNSKNWVLIHDLRIEHNGEVAQIDHLLIGRMLDIYVIESKNFTYDLSISDEGDFSYFYHNRPYSMPSPIAQNERNINALVKLTADKNLLPRRLGVTLKPAYRNIVLISQKSHLTKPKKGFYDCTAVMKTDKFADRFTGDQDNDDVLSDFSNISKVISQESLMKFAGDLTGQHKPLDIDYAKKFGLTLATETEVSLRDVVNSPECPVCGKAMVLREAKKGKTEGKKFWGCTQFPKCRGVIEFEQEIAVEESNNEADPISSEPLFPDPLSLAPLCPKCNGEMVKRMSKKGKNAGKEFLGCKDFPNCRGVVSID